MRVIECSINELTVLLVYHVVVQYYLVTALRPYNTVWLFLHCHILLHISERTVPNPYKALLHKVHLINFLRLLTNYHIFIYTLKSARYQALSYIIKHQLVYLWQRQYWLKHILDSD